MTRSFAYLIALVPAVAAAQPAPTFATSPDDHFVPLGEGGWPLGHSFEDLRYLHECQLGELGAAKPGDPIPCRPPIAENPAHIFWGIDWTTGLAFATSDATERTTGGAHGLGVDVQYAATRSILVGARYELMGFGVPVPRGGDGTAGLSHQVFALAKKRFFLDETGRTSWTLGAGLGYAFRSESLGGFAPMARVSISRDTGLPVGDSTAGIAQLELAFEQALDTERAAAVLASVRIGWEHGIREPENLGGSPPSDEAHGGRWTMSGDIRLGPALGLGTSFGVRLAGPLSLQTTAMFEFGRSNGALQHGFEGAQWSALSGFRVTLPVPAAAPIYVQGQVGPAWIGHDAGRAVRLVGDGELGFRYAGCGIALDLGGYVRSDIQDGWNITDGGFVMRVAVGSGPAAFGTRQRESCGGYSAPTFAHAPPPPPPPPPPVPVPPPVVVEAPVVVAPPPVVVEVRPVVIELDLGAALFGGAVQIRIDPRMLPLAALRAAGFVQIDLTGPYDALAPFQAHLGAALSRNGARIDAWTTRSTDSSVVHARFTIWPPGSRP